MTARKHISRKRRVARSLSLLLAVGLLFVGEQAYRLLCSNLRSQDGADHVVYVYPETTLDGFIAQLSESYHIGSVPVLKLHARLLSWTSPERPFVHTGRYRIPAESGDLSFIRMMRSGRQEAVSLRFGSLRTPEQLAGCLAEQLMLDSLTVLTALCDTAYMARYDQTPATAVCLFLPNTYEVWWDVSCDKLFQRMHSEYNAFWTEERRALAEKAGLTPVEVATLASIVDEETNVAADKPVIAGLYLNRLRIGMPLQSCPTVKFALQDFGLRRITNRHLQVVSPYNTYLNQGLPPGPIRLTPGRSLDAVLHYQPSSYLYMCASAKLDGTHHFSSNYAEHAAHARAYQRELNRRKIYQ